MKLTTDEQHAIESGQAVPVEVNQTDCVILRRDVFIRVQHLIYDDGELSPDEMQALLAQIGDDAGWNEPKMDAYDNYDEERKKLCP